MPTKRKLDIAKALKQKAQGMSYADIAKQQGVHVTTAHQAITAVLKQLAAPEVVEQYRQNQSQILDGLAAKTVASITDEDFSKAGLQAKVTSAAILIDKSRLIQGESTANVSVVSKMLFECPDLPDMVTVDKSVDK